MLYRSTFQSKGTTKGHASKSLSLQSSEQQAHVALTPGFDCCSMKCISSPGHPASKSLFNTQLQSQLCYVYVN